MKASRRKYLISLIIYIMIGTVFFYGLTISPVAASQVKIGQANCNEKGGSYGGKAGDQTGNEVSISSWSYSKSYRASDHWVYVFRAKDQNVARKLAKSMKDACNNQHIGYDLNDNDRETLFYAAKKANWNIAAVKTDCETTCVDLVSVCLNSAGIKMPSVWASVLVYKDLMKTGEFDCFTSSDYTSSSSKLRAGDILCNPNAPHTAMVVEAGTANTASIYKAGKNYQLTTALNIRKGPGTSYAVKTNAEITREAKQYSIGKSQAVLNKGTVVTCVKADGNWIQTPSGWICGRENGSNYVVEYTGTDAQKNLYNKARVNNISTTNATSSAKKVVQSTVSKNNINKTSTKNNNTKKLVLKKNKDYKLKADMNVRSGPGLKYRILKRNELTASGRKSAYAGTNAVLKKGTIVTCLQIKGDWMRIPSGWICCKAEYVENYN